MTDYADRVLIEQKKEAVRQALADLLSGSTADRGA